MAANFIENQHVAKRRYSSPSYKDNNKSAFFSADIMYQFKQKPAHIRRRKDSGKPFFSVFKIKRPSHSKTAIFAAKPADREIHQSKPETRRQHKSGQRPSGLKLTGSKPIGFSFPIPSLMTLSVIAGTVIISLFALNWDGLRNLPTDNSFRPPADENSIQHIINYAGAGVPSVLPVLGVSQTNTTDIIENAVFDIDEFPLGFMETFEWSGYRVQKGDSVSKIAAQFGISMDAVITSNDIRNARLLREGETLRIPNMDGIRYTVKKGDSLVKISKTYNVPLEIILDVNDIRTDAINEGEILFIPGARMPLGDLRLSLGELFIYPIRKNISSNYGWREDPFTGVQSFHSGIDLRGDIGTPVKAALDGTVAVVGNDRVYGRYIILSHYGGYQTLYAHLSAYSVKQGDRVIQGGKIGEVGNTGLSTGPHLHFGVFKNGTRVNPLDLMN